MLVLCEVFYPDGTPHETNTRAKLEALIDDKVRAEQPLYGFEQVIYLCVKFTLFKQGTVPAMVVTVGTAPLHTAVRLAARKNCLQQLFADLVVPVCCFLLLVPSEHDFAFRRSTHC